MITIHKYPITFNPIPNKYTISLPMDAEVLDVQMQGSNLVLWAMIDDNEGEFRDVTYHIFFTGEKIDRSLALLHRKTINHHSFILHIFEEINIFPHPEEE